MNWFCRRPLQTNQRLATRLKRRRERGRSHHQRRPPTPLPLTQLPPLRTPPPTWRQHQGVGQGGFQHPLSTPTCPPACIPPPSCRRKVSNPSSPCWEVPPPPPTPLPSPTPTTHLPPRPASTLPLAGHSPQGGILEGVQGTHLGSTAPLLLTVGRTAPRLTLSPLPPPTPRRLLAQPPPPPPTSLPPPPTPLPHPPCPHRRVRGTPSLRRLATLRPWISLLRLARLLLSPLLDSMPHPLVHTTPRPPWCPQEDEGGGPTRATWPQWGMFLTGEAGGEDANCVQCGCVDTGFVWVMAKLRSYGRVMMPPRGRGRRPSQSNLTPGRHVSDWGRRWLNWNLRFWNYKFKDEWKIKEELQCFWEQGEVVIALLLFCRNIGKVKTFWSTA